MSAYGWKCPAVINVSIQTSDTSTSIFFSNTYYFIIPCSPSWNHLERTQASSQASPWKRPAGDTDAIQTSGMLTYFFYVSAMFYYILKHSPLSLACLQSWWNPAIDLQSPVGKAIDRLSFQHRSTGFPSFRLLLQCFPDICIRFLAGLRWFLLVLFRCVLPSNPLALLPSTLHRPILVKNMTPKLWEQKGWLACLPAIPPAPEESRPHHLPWQLWDPPLSIQDISKYLKFEAHIRLAKRKVAQAVLWGRQWQILLLAVLHRAAEGPQLLWTIRRVPVPSEWKGLRPPQHEMISHPPHEIM